MNDNFIKQLYNPKIDKKSLLSLAKSSLNKKDLTKFLNKTGNHSFVKRYFYGEPFPNSYEKVSQEFIQPFTDFETEFKILIINLTKFHKEINEYVVLRNAFQTNLLSGEYKIAYGILDDIEAKFGKSIWHLENKFILEEILNGLEGNKNLLNKFNLESNNAYGKIFCYFLSIRAEKNISSANYSNQLTSFLEGVDSEIVQYLNFRLDFLNTISEIKDLSIPIHYDTILSIIDRYETFLKVCQIALTDEIFSDENTTIKSLIPDLKEKINDPIFDSILLAHELLDLNKIINNFSDSSLNLFENYSSGLYEKSLEKSIELIYAFPNDFSFWEILCKSVLYLNIPNFHNLDLQGTVRELILNVINILAENEYTSDSIINIRKFISVYESFPIAKQLHAFLEYEIFRENSFNFETFSLLNAGSGNPLFHKIFKSRNASISYSKYLEIHKPLNVTRLFNELNIADSISSLNFINQLQFPEYRKIFYYAKGLERLGLKNEAILSYNKILHDFPTLSILYRQTTHNLLNCYLEQSDFKAYLELYVTNTFRKNTTKYMFHEIHKKIESRKFLGLEKSLHLPIFYYLTKSNHHHINITIRFLLRSFDCKIPTELIQFKEYFEPSLLIYFFRYVCTQEVMKFFIHLKSTKEILNERLGICKILIALDKENESVYNDEIGAIAKTIIISEGLRQVDESKIFVDEKGIRSNELYDVRNLFERYISLVEMLGKVDIVIMDIKSLKQLLKKLKSDDAEEDFGDKTRTIDIKFGYFKEIFIMVRDKFLFNSKYGLDAYLSTRIRHGTLLGQIRSKFQDYHLITQKDKEEGIYSENDYWLGKTDFSSTDRVKVNEWLSSFSNNIDTLTNKLKNELIQIRIDEQKQIGLFNYVYSNNSLYDLFSNEFQSLKTFEEFIDRVFYLLWKQTNNNLSNIRHYIASTVRDQYILYLEILENEIKTLPSEINNSQELINNIVSCKTTINWELLKISNWFQIKETDVKDFTIDKAIDTSIEITNQISGSTKIFKIEKNILSSSQIKGEYFISIFDLLRIFFDNITKYSGNNSETLCVKIQVTEVEKLLKIKIVNNIKDHSFQNISNIKQTFRKKYEDLNSPDWDMERIKTEGNTGFYKAKKILVSDLKSENNTFIFLVNEHNEVEINLEIYLI